MTIEEMLKDFILTQYKSIREFCVVSNVPYSTLTNIFKRGIMGSGVSNVIKICKALNIDTESLINGEIKERAIDNITSEEKNVVQAYRSKPQMQEAVNTLLGVSKESANNER